jgi:hypothetical protein
MKARRVAIPWWVKEGWGCEGMHLPPQVTQLEVLCSNFTNYCFVIFCNNESQFFTLSNFQASKSSNPRDEGGAADGEKGLGERKLRIG